MYKKNFFFYLSSYLLFYLALSTPINYSCKKRITSKKPPLSRAIITGDKKGLSKSELKIFRDLNLLHIFTPSGLHYSSLRALLNLLLSTSILNMFLLPVFRFYTDLFSLQRMSLFYTLKSFFDLEVAFFVTFIFEFFLGNWSSSPLSFCYSYLFFGTIILNVDRSKLEIVGWLAFSILLSKYIMYEKVYPLSLLFNTPLTILFSLMLPIFAFTYVINSFLWIERLFLTICHFCQKVIHILPELEVEAWHVIIVFIILGIKKGQLKAGLSLLYKIT